MAAVGTEAEAKAAEAWVEAEREAVARAVKEVEDIPKTRGSLRADAKTKSHELLPKYEYENHLAPVKAATSAASAAEE
jgi:hypothetical protein